VDWVRKVVVVCLTLVMEAVVKVAPPINDDSVRKSLSDD